MKGKMVLHHDDGCQSKLLLNGWCPDCKLFPDMQSIQFLLYCPICCIPVNGDACSRCHRKIKWPYR